MHRYIDIATLIQTKNLDGGLVARSAAGFPFLLEEGMEVWLVPPVIDAPRQGVVESVGPVSGDEAVVRLSTVTDAETARALVGSHILAVRDEVITEGLAMPVSTDDNLEGFEVRALDGSTIGTIVRIDKRTAQWLLVVDTPEEREVLIPFVDDFIDEVADGVLVLDVPAGLLDL